MTNAPAAATAAPSAAELTEELDALAVLEALALADDLEVVRAAEDLYERLMGALASVEVTALMADAPPSMQTLQHALEQQQAVQLSDTESISVARWTLRQLARSPQGRRLVLDALQHWRDDTQRVGTRVQWTLAGTLLLLVVTTEVDYGPAGLRIHKKTVIPAEVEATVAFLKGKVNLKVFDPAPVPATPPPTLPGS